MSINIKFDLTGNPESPSIILANRSGNKLGQLNVNVESIEVSDKFNAASELSFTLNKYIDGEPTPYWDKVVDFKLVYCPEWDMWFEAKVELDETTETVKTVFCTQLGQAELSQIMLYNVHINEEGDTNWNTENQTYKSTVLYDAQNTDVSLLHRLLRDKAPHYSIDYVDPTIQRIQRQFSFDDTSICDAFDEIAEEIGCLFVYNSNSGKNGIPNRTISVYDLQQNCLNPNCKHRGEFTDVCPKCNSKDDSGNKYGIKYGHGEDTTIFVTSDELATEGIQLVTDTDSVKNCFKLEAGDDLMTATIRNCNPNGTDYIWYFSDSIKEDMSKELVDGIESYDEKYRELYNEKEYVLDENLVNQYNQLVEKYKEYYNTTSTCLDCKAEGDFEEQCSNAECGSKNILTGQKLQRVSSLVKGYPALMTTYYDTIDLLLYLKSSLMPNIEMSDTTAEEQVELLTELYLTPIAVNVEKIKNASESTAKSAVLSMAKVIVRPTYEVDVKEGSSSLSEDIYSDADGEYRIWSGQFVVTNYSDEKDTAISNIVSIKINNATEAFIKQKIEKVLNKEDTDDYSISGLFAKEIKLDENGEHIVDADGNCQCEFCAELKKYALNPLDSFYKVCDTCLSILTEQGAGNKDEEDLYNGLYMPYYRKSQSIAKEMKIRENEIAIIEGVYDESNEDRIEPDVDGLQTNIAKIQSEIQKGLDFENYIVEKGVESNKDLWLEFCSYRREDKYSNDNYISDGLNNAELFKKANEFIEVAEEEIFKSAELQHSISATLNNLLALPKFKPLIKSFKTGNWIRVQVDDKVHKLRLLKYDFSYGDLESIPVEFSDVTKIKNGMTDVQDVFSQASSIASSYDSVQRQAKKGDVARNAIDQWLIDGLNNADVQIKSNDSEEVLLTKNGLLARSYDDITKTYSPEQLKITHNIMAYTDDDWETVKQAIGKHDYKYFDKNEGSFVDRTGYGMTAEFVTAGYVSGSQIIGGDIYSDNYSIADAKGSYLNLRDGTFSFGGGSLRFDGTDLLISSPSVVTKNEVTAINEEYLKTTNVYAQNLQVNSAKIQGKLTADQINTTGLIAENISTTTIDGKTITGGSLLIGDKNTNTYAEINTSGKLICSNADIKGGGTIAGFSIGDTSIYSGTNSLMSTNAGIYLGTNGIRQYASEQANVTISNGVLNANGAVIDGDIRAKTGSIGGFTIENQYLNIGYFGEDRSVFLCANDYIGTLAGVYAQNWRMSVGSHFGVTSDGVAYMSDCRISGGSFKIGDDSVNVDTPYTSISTDGTLHCRGGSLKFTTSDQNSTIEIGNGKDYIQLASADYMETEDSGIGHSLKIGCRSLTDGSDGRYAISYANYDFHDSTNAVGIAILFETNKKICRLAGTWQSDSSIEVISDANKKNSIQQQSEVYSRIFDRLNPVIFKYNNGTSDRIHTGFIAQEVEEAVIAEGLTTQDFAAVCYDVDENGNKCDYGIRYEEIVSMNTYEVQKVKTRIATLEDYVQKLEKRIAELENKH